jgi:hypothetical protein
MASSPRLEQLPHQTITEILNYLPLESLYVLERTSQKLRDIVSFNSFLKYSKSCYTARGLNALERKSYINPLKHGFYAVHHGWGHITFILHAEYGHNARVWKGQPEDDTEDSPSTNYSLSSTNLLNQSAVYPPLSRLFIQSIYVDSDSDVEIVGKDGGYVTFDDILSGLVSNAKGVDFECSAVYEGLGWKKGDVFFICK